jgi:hypothetical protein
MPVTKETSAPYAPTSAIIELIGRHRQKGLPSPVTEDVLQRAGISTSLTSRTIQALVTLDLIDERGHPTPTLEGIRLAPGAEYRERLADWLRLAYADALSFIDPTQDDETKIRDAFRSYKPVGQQNRMVTLFTGLCEAAGLMPERKRQRAKPIGKNADPIRRTKPPAADNDENVKPAPAPPPGGDPKTEKQTNSVVSQLLDKFPSFDPTWAPEIQAKWFEGYDRLLKMGEK